MGTLVSIGIQAENNSSRAVYERLINRLLKYGSLQTVELHEKFLYSGAITQYEDIPPDIETFLRAIESSENALSIGIAYPLQIEMKGDYVPLTVSFCGSSIDSGFRVLCDGFIDIAISYHDLKPNTPILSLDDVMLRVEQGQPWLQITAIDDPEMLENAEEIFLRVCGVLDEPDPKLLHAAMYLETGWPSGESCAMVYHRNVQDFAQDFAHTYALHRWGIFPPTIWQHDVDVWALSDEQRKSLQMLTPAPHERKLFFPPDLPKAEVLARREFQDSLDQATARRLSLLPQQTVRQLLEQAGDDVPAIRCHDFGPAGFAICTYPMGAVWRVYQLMRAAREQ